MDKKIQKVVCQPDYKRIYSDFIAVKCPEKKEIVACFLSKDTLSLSDILKMNNLLFDKNSAENQKHKSYDENTILEMLEYQKKHRLNNTQLANHFKLSRNSVAKWKRMFLK